MSALIPRPGIMKIAAYVGGESKIPGVAEPIKLASNEGALGPSPKAMQAFADLAKNIFRYPDGGSTDIRKALGEYHGLDPARIVCTNGSDEMLTLLTRAYAGPGDEVLFCEHGFAMYPISTLSVGATPVVAKEKNLRTDVDAMLKLASPKTKLVFLANPNNPTGSYIPAEDVDRLAKNLPPHALLVLDSAYAEYVTRNDYTSGVELVDKYPNVVMTRTFSKIYALAGVRLGWAYCSVELADVLNRLRGPFNVTLPAQVAGVAALRDVAHLDACRTHNDIWLPWFSAQCNKLGLETPPSVGNFVLVKFPKDDAHNAEKANAFLVSRGIIVRKVANYGLPEYLRVTIGREDEVRAVVAALTDFMKS